MSTSAFGVDHGGEISKRKWGFDPDKRKEEWQTRAAAGALGAASGGGGALLGNQIGNRKYFKGQSNAESVKGALKSTHGKVGTGLAAAAIGSSFALERHAKKTGVIRRVQPGEKTNMFGRIKSKKS